MIRIGNSWLCVNSGRSVYPILEINDTVIPLRIEYPPHWEYQVSYDLLNLLCCYYVGLFSLPLFFCGLERSSET